MSNRGEEFIEFAAVVVNHIDTYGVAQYGDAPFDMVEEWSAEQCIAAIRKYAARAGASRRGRLEELRDMVKIAHYACLAYSKMQPTVEEIAAIKEGRT